MEKLILSRSEVLTTANISGATLWRWCKAGIFPKPVQLGPARVGWRRADVEAWAAGLDSAGGQS